jgi:hypothetical protein
MKLLQYLKALRLCAVQCFNANQVTQHNHYWLREAVRAEEDAFADLPKIAQIILNKYL